LLMWRQRVTWTPQRNESAWKIGHNKLQNNDTERHEGRGHRAAEKNMDRAQAWEGWHLRVLRGQRRSVGQGSGGKRRAREPARTRKAS
jgi:hypothetical protein